MEAKLSPQKLFIQTYQDDIKDACSGTGLFPSVCMAQFILESGWGKSINSAANNGYGIKAYKSWTGPVMSTDTTEVVDGQRVHVEGTGKRYDNRNLALADGANRESIFRAYESIKESIIDRNQLLLTADRYKLAREATTPETQIQEIVKAGYATGENYAGVIMQIIDKYGLNELDQ